ncbi:hypothetical protein LTS18_009025 [Coniosporium uncinatum]|uniref:Uncharacterized protein n=1 Tax=Coniosporium uncinatum TaxID=93489 RepID=A0ACC3D0W7_9PEZI|nr:hypothetical protein LTS18_009025 [Coniosporium uncinatum]
MRMSKQYLTLHTLDSIHPTDIFTLAATPTSIFTGNGSSSIQIHNTYTPPSAARESNPATSKAPSLDAAAASSAISDTSTSAEFGLVQTLKGAHPLGCHHIAVCEDGHRAVSAGFGGDLRVWSRKSGAPGSEEKEHWLEEDVSFAASSTKTGEIWAVTLSANGQYLASTTHDGRINVWDLSASAEDGTVAKIREYETKGSWGMCVHISSDGRFTASGHENGGVYIFNNDTGRLLHSLPGLIKPVRSVAFSPASTLLAAAGDSRTIALYEVSSGEQVANLSGHAAWVMSLDWNSTGEYLLSGSFDGRAKVWNTATRTCVATHGETDKPLWCVKWLPKRQGRSEMFAVAGATGGVGILREATGG